MKYADKIMNVEDIHSMAEYDNNKQAVKYLERMLYKARSYENTDMTKAHMVLDRVLRGEKRKRGELVLWVTKKSKPKSLSRDKYNVCLR